MTVVGRSSRHVQSVCASSCDKRNHDGDPHTCRQTLARQAQVVTVRMDIRAQAAFRSWISPTIDKSFVGMKIMLMSVSGIRSSIGSVTP